TPSTKLRVNSGRNLSQSLAFARDHGLRPSLRRRRNHRAARLTSAQFLITRKLLVNLPHRIGAVIADLNGSFVNLLAALIAEPPEMIDFTRAALAFENNEPGIFLEARRVGHAGGTKEDLASFYV